MPTRKPKSAALTADQLQQRLRAPKATRALAGAIVGSLRQERLRDVLDPAELSESVVRWASSLASEGPLEARAEQAIEAALVALAKERRPLGKVLPESARRAAMEAADRSFTLDRAVLRKVLDRPPVRRLLRELFFDALVAFGEKVRAPVAESSIARSFGGLGKFAAEQVKERTGSLGVLASGVAGAVRGEVERQWDKRSVEVADAALHGILGRLVEALGDPARAREQAALRSALVEGVLELTGAELAAEARRYGPAAAAKRARAALAAWAASKEAKAQAKVAIEALLGGDLDRTVGALLDEWGLSKRFEEELTRTLAPRLQALFEADLFETFLRELYEGG